MPSLRERLRAAADRISAYLRNPQATNIAASEQLDQAARADFAAPDAIGGRVATPDNGVAAEEFPPLPLSPFHRNALVARGEAAGIAAPTVPWDLPGNEHYPNGAGRRVNAMWLEHPILPCLVWNKVFMLPVALLCQYEYWRGYFSSPVPTNLRCIEVDPGVFGFLLEVLVSSHGLDRTEPGMNLVLITAGMAMALSFEMHHEFAKLSLTFKRYLVQRVLHRNPYRPDMENILDHEYFVYRSEELYRAYNMIVLHERLAAVINPIEIATLYWLAIPQDLWPALTTSFDDPFVNMIEFIAHRDGTGPERRFPDVYRDAFRDAGYLAPAWMHQPPAPVPRNQDDFFAHDNGSNNEEVFNIPDPFELAVHPEDPPVAEIHIEDSIASPSPATRSHSAPAVMITLSLSEGNTLVNDTSEQAKEDALLAELAEPVD